MPSKPVPYYLVRDYHKSIFGHSEPVSFFELIYMVEAPAHFSGINIWESVESLPAESLNLYYDLKGLDSFKISREDLENYPYYELFLRMYFNRMDYPLIFTKHKDHVGLVALEGSHRIRMIMLFFMLRGRWPQIPALVVDEVEIRMEEQTFEGCEKFQLWEKWREQNAIKEQIEKAKGLWNEFLRKE